MTNINFKLPKIEGEERRRGPGRLPAGLFCGAFTLPESKLDLGLTFWAFILWKINWPNNVNQVVYVLHHGKKGFLFGF